MSKHLSFILCLVWLAVRSVSAASLEPGLIAQIHFAGAQAVAADPNSTALNYLWASPDAAALRNQTLDKLARSLGVWLPRQIAPNLAAPVPLRPLLDDFCQSEWQLDLREPVAGTVEFALAIRLDEARASVWRTDLAPLLAAWQQNSPAHHAALTRKGAWLVLEMGNSPTPLVAGNTPLLKKIWLTAAVNWARLSQFFPELAKFDLPQTVLQVTAQDNTFVLDGKLFLSQNLPPPQSWQFPLNTIHSPFISFTAARGISTWLRQQPWAGSLGLNPLPDQVFAWANPQLPFETYAAAPVPAAGVELPLLKPFLSSTFKLGVPNTPFQECSLVDSNHQLSFAGLPFISPYIDAKRDGAGEFLLAGFMPNLAFGQQAPAGLISQLNAPGLVFYHWEITSARFKLFPQLYQLLLLISWHHQLDVNSAAGRWLAHIAPDLGPSVTGVTRTGPNELTFSRKGSVPLTAVELVALASWLEAPDFPGCDLRMPPPKKMHRPAPKPPGTPVPFNLHH